jgi:uncharacterized damage-inducible protein DinB
MLAHHFRFMAAYHKHATVLILNSVNGSLPQKAASVVVKYPTDIDYQKLEPCLYFGSIHGTLNHLLGAEELWFHRLAASNMSLPAPLREFVSEGTAKSIGSIYSLDSTTMREAWERRVLDRLELHERLLCQCDAWEELVRCVDQSCDDSATTRTCTYKDTAGVPSEVVLASGLTQVFNHGTHHRGQITAALNCQRMSISGGVSGCDIALDMQGMGSNFLTYGGFSNRT